jgi:hypothetical protein
MLISASCSHLEYLDAFNDLMEISMQRHRFEMRLDCHYANENSIDSLKVKHLDGDEWKNLELDIQTPGFLIFTYAVFTCQHMFLRVNANERGLQLASSSGSIMIDAAPDWKIEKLHVAFDAIVKSGTPTADDIDYITGRMQLCPVSKNLGEIPDTQTELLFS